MSEIRKRRKKRNKLSVINEARSSGHPSNGQKNRVFLSVVVILIKVASANLKKAIKEKRTEKVNWVHKKMREKKKRNRKKVYTYTINNDVICLGKCLNGKFHGEIEFSP